MVFLNEKEEALIEAALRVDDEIEDAIFEEFDNFPFSDMADEGDTVISEDDNIIDDGKVVEDDILLYNPADIMCENKEAHRCKLKLGPIPYMSAWMDGFTETRNVYKPGSRLYKAYMAGKRANG